MAEDLISALVWVPRASVQSTPIAYELSPEEINNIESMQNLSMESDGEEEKVPEEKSGEEVSEDDEDEEIDQDDEGSADEDVEFEAGKLDKNGLPAELRMDDYDNDPDVSFELEGENEIREAEMMANFMAEAAAKEERAKRNEGNQELIDEAGSDAEDFVLKPDDKILLAAHTEEEYSCLEVYVYDEETGSFYIHHDITLPAFPLCMAWMGCGPEVMSGVSSTNSRNYVAIGTFHPAIEIWNVDILDALEPNVSLGGFEAMDDGMADESTKKKKKSKSKKKAPKLKDGSHTDAVMGLSWNTHHEQLLASCSADKTTKLWDVSKQTCVHTWSHHTDKVQTVQWNPIESNILLTGSFDQTVAVFDARQAKPSTAKFSVSADVECVVWDAWNPAQFYVATEDGNLACYDVRSTDSVPVFSFQAHKKATSAVTLSARVPGMLATSSMDKTVRIWDVKDLKGNVAPKPVTEKAMAIGPIFDCNYCVDDPFVLAAGGTKGMVSMWDTVDDANVDEVFSSRILSA